MYAVSCHFYLKPISGVTVVGAMMHGMSCARMCRCVKMDDDDAGANVRAHELCGEGDRCGRRVVGMQKYMEMRKSECV